MNVNDIYSCIPLDTPVEEICYRAKRMDSAEVDKCNSILMSVIRKVIAEWMPAKFPMFRHCHASYVEYKPSWRITGTTDISLSVDAEYDSNEGSLSNDCLVYIRMHTPYGVTLCDSAARLVGKLMLLKTLFSVASVGNDNHDGRLITNILSAKAVAAISSAVNAQSLEEIVLNLSLDGVEV